MSKTVTCENCGNQKVMSILSAVGTLCPSCQRGKFGLTEVVTASAASSSGQTARLVGGAAAPA